MGSFSVRSAFEEAVQTVFFKVVLPVVTTSGCDTVVNEDPAGYRCENDDGALVIPHVSMTNTTQSTLVGLAVPDANLAGVSSGGVLDLAWRLRACAKQSHEEAALNRCLELDDNDDVELFVLSAGSSIDLPNQHVHVLTTDGEFESHSETAPEDHVAFVCTQERDIENEPNRRESYPTPCGGTEQFELSCDYDVPFEGEE